MNSKDPYKRFTGLLWVSNIKWAEDPCLMRISKERAASIIDTRKPQGRFYYYDSDFNKYIGIDNLDGEAWTEEFDTKADCLAWLINTCLD